MRFRGASVEARTEAGRWTVDLLDLNEDGVVAYRARLLSIVGRLTREFCAWETVLSAIRAELELVDSEERRDQLRTAEKSTESEITTLLNELKFFIPDIDN